MTEIIPAILPKNYEDLKNKVALVRGYAAVAQIDICDGEFVKSLTWPFISRGEFDEHFNFILNEREGLPFWEDIDFELDLMVANAVRDFDIYTKLGARRIVFHLEAIGEINNFKEFIEGIDVYVRDTIELGVAISPTTDVKEIFPLLYCIDFVQVMGIKHAGFQGEDFDPKCIEQIKIIKEKFRDIPISVDGSVNRDTAPLLIDAGATRLVIGSAIFNSDDIIGMIESFENL